MSDPFVAAACRGLSALAPPARLLVAVSGGADSVALLQALVVGRRRRALSRLELVVGHVDHRLRPDSEADYQLVRAHAERLGLSFQAARVTVETKRGGLEEAAREARYASLERLALESGCGAVVTAHTATDQAETLLWRLARGAGAKGLGGMSPRRALGPLWLLRPLLEVTREESRAYCERHGLPFRDDPTNVNDRPRARLRAEVLPVLERLAPGATLRIAAAALRLRADDDALEDVAEPHLAALPHVEGLAQLPQAVRRRVLAAWYARETGTRRRLAAAHLEGLDRLVATGRGEVELPASRMTRRVASIRERVLVLDERSRARSEEAGREGAAKEPSEGTDERCRDADGSRE